MIGFNLLQGFSRKGKEVDKTPGNKLFVIFGESNSGGVNNNSELTNLESSERNIKILNNSTLNFEKLHIGVNNTIGHNGLNSTMGHSFENELANKYDEGYWGEKTVYILKSGQGGSLLYQWDEDDSSGYYSLLITRMNSVISQLFDSENPIDIEMMLTIGLNDKVGGTDIDLFRDKYKNLIQRIRQDLNLPNLKFNFMLFNWDAVKGNMTGYNNQIYSVSTELNNCSTFGTSGIGYMPDQLHISTSGMREACNNFLKSI